MIVTSPIRTTPAATSRADTSLTGLGKENSRRTALSDWALTAVAVIMHPLLSMAGRLPSAGSRFRRAVVELLVVTAHDHAARSSVNAVPSREAVGTGASRSPPSPPGARQRSPRAETTSRRPLLHPRLSGPR